ncbi:hypothetical protein AB0I91_39920 [Actinosynnema sp. NPDC049800]
MVAMTVWTYYMPNAEWRVICARGRALREAAGTLAGHAVGDDAPRPIDSTSVVKAIVSGAADGWVVDLPEPLAAVVDHLGEELEERRFVPTSELVEALEIEAVAFAREMSELGCSSATRGSSWNRSAVSPLRSSSTWGSRGPCRGSVARKRLGCWRR